MYRRRQNLDYLVSLLPRSNPNHIPKHMDIASAITALDLFQRNRNRTDLSNTIASQQWIRWLSPLEVSRSKCCSM